MRLLRFIPIQLTLFLVIGILIGHYFKINVIPPCVATLLGLVVIGLLYNRKNQGDSIGFPIALCVTTICLGMLSISFTFPKNQGDHYVHQLISEKHTWHLKVRTILKPTSFSNRYIVKVKGMDSLKVSGKIVISLPVDSINDPLNVDDELWAYGILEQPKPPLNPHQFNYKAYLESLGIFHILRLEPQEYTLVKNRATTVLGLAHNTRNNIIKALRKSDFGTAELGVIQALLLGQRHDISEATYNDYKSAGAVHILAVSGLHIGVLLWLLNFLLQPLERLRYGKKIKLGVVVLLLWGFALLAGFSASVVRAVTMFSFVAYALYLNRPSNIFNILALSMFTILLAIDPKLLFQVGFQMSYAAVFAIVWIYPLLEKLWFPKNKLLRKVWQLLCVSVAAQLGVLPISLFYFHQFPSLFFISNLLIVPALGLILGMGILVIILALIQFLPSILVSIYDTMIQWMNSIIAWVAKQESFVFKDISFDMVQLFLAYGILICFVWLLEKYTFRRVISLAFFIITFQLWLFHTSIQTQGRDELLVAHQTRNTVLMHQTGNKLAIMMKDTSNTSKIAIDYKVGERIKTLDYKPLGNSYEWRNKKLLVIDSFGIYKGIGINPDYILLTESPKLNLERLIDSIRPKRIIADGSNYKSYVTGWAETCKERKLPFHYTGEKGAYYLNSAD